MNWVPMQIWALCIRCTNSKFLGGQHTSLIDLALFPQNCTPLLTDLDSQEAFTNLHLLKKNHKSSPPMRLYELAQTLICPYMDKSPIRSRNLKS